ncbi:hypothetical protein E8E13_000156 [Curvularia kusanoi]|uniref:FAD-binding domain-containing protein n=1 Tax=Curvularia kusanoi TaxID=90978 RepID=A0A9P4W904_CURKU|nr:hypothetical protein E8E13_000156 [Curvularia kusanoi]
MPDVDSIITDGEDHIHEGVAHSCRRDLAALLTYPSQSLKFLEALCIEKELHTNISSASTCPKQAKIKLRIVIVGAGLGGLALCVALARRGHAVRVLEQAKQLGEVGAGIQIPPNSGRLLHRWGVFQHLARWAVKPEGINFRRWEDGRVIGHTDLGERFQRNFGVPYYVVHRAHFHDALYKRALELGVVVDLDRTVVEYDSQQGSVILADRSVVTGDLVVAADGIKSVARASICQGTLHEPSSEGFAAYRATVNVSRISDDSEIAWILEKPSLNIWIGEDRHVMSYTIASGQSLNLVLSHIDHSDPSTWSKTYAKEQIMEEFSGWDPQLTKILALVDDCMKWPLKVGKQLSTWISPSSRLVLVGDAAHAMLPYMSQGAAMAVEDGAALAVILSDISTLSDLPSALRSFEKERIRRSGDMQHASMVNGVIWHFPDGPEQEARDASMAAEVSGKPFTSSANQWSDPVTQRWAYGYDAEKEMREVWRKDTGAVFAGTA